MTDPTDRCRATNRDGSPCRAKARPNRAHCWQHDEALAAARDGWRKAGGYGKRTEARARKAMPADLRDVGDLLLEAMRDVRAGSLTPATAHALAALSRAYVGVHEVAATDARLSQIEEMLKGMTA